MSAQFSADHSDVAIFILSISMLESSRIPECFEKKHDEFFRARTQIRSLGDNKM
jgi:hypothetical protein